MTPARFANLVVALILGVLVACAIDLGSEDPLPPPEPRCNNLTLETCIARVQGPDAGTDK